VQIVEIETISQLLDDHDYGLAFAIFRGQLDSSWGVAPSLFRYGEKITGFDYQSWLDLEDLLLKQFKLSAVPYIEKTPTNDIEWLIHAQHHGLPTRLLDWSSNPLKALYFCLDDEAYDDVDGVLYRHTGHGISVNPDGLPPLNGIQHLIAFQPPKLNVRIVGQEGHFTIFPFPEGKGVVPYLDDHPFFEDDRKNLKKYVIPANCKSRIRKELRILGVRPNSIYPGLDGVAEDIKKHWAEIT